MAGRQPINRGGTRSPLLMALLGAMGGGEPLAGVKFEDSIQPGTIAPDGSSQGVNYTKKAVPTGLFNGFFNRGKAENVNNQITLDDILGQQKNAQAVGLEGKIGPMRTEQDRIQGNYGLLNRNNLTANPDNLNMFNTTTTVPTLGKILAGTAADTDKAESESLGLARQNEIAANTQPANIDAARNSAELNKILTGLQVGAANSTFLNQQQKQTLGNKLLDAQIKATLNPVVPIGGERVNLESGEKIMGPPKPDPNQALLDLMTKMHNKNAGGNTPANPPITQMNAPTNALPKITVPPDASVPSEGSVIMKDGKPGKIINGIFVPFKGQ